MRISREPDDSALKRIPVIDARLSGWRDAVAQEYVLLRNFVIILPASQFARDELMRLLFISEDGFPEQLDRMAIYRISRYLDYERTSLLQLAQASGVIVLFIEQKHLPENRPPRIRPFMIYCEFRGIVSHHDSQAEARLHWLNYNRDGLMKGDLPEAWVYGWINGEWRILR
jgi:hypothetical protein